MRHLRTALQTVLVAASVAFATPQAGAVTPLSDPQILHVLKTLNDGEMRLSQLALTRLQLADASAFARMMILHHGDNNRQIQSVSSRFRVPVLNNALSFTLQGRANAALRRLSRTSPRRFDAYYVSQQISMHRQALLVLDTELLPQARSTQIRLLLQATRSVVVDHLHRAMTLQASRRW